MLKQIMKSMRKTSKQQKTSYGVEEFLEKNILFFHTP
jgi:hypothetical protein